MQRSHRPVVRDIQVRKKSLTARSRKIFQTVVDRRLQPRRIRRLRAEIGILAWIDFPERHHAFRQRLAKINLPGLRWRGLGLAARQTECAYETHEQQNPSITNEFHDVPP